MTWDKIESKLKPRAISSGFIIRGRDGRYLLGRATFENESAWTAFKGHVEEGETLIEAATRELKEETGIDVTLDERLCKSMSTNYVFQYSMKNKDVFLFFLDDKDGALDNVKFECNSFWGNGNPEILEYKWFELDEMQDILFPSQKGMVPFLRGMKKNE